LIGFPDLGAYERYREALAADPAAAECLERAEGSGCIVSEDRSFLQLVS